MFLSPDVQCCNVVVTLFCFRLCVCVSVERFSFASHDLRKNAVVWYCCTTDRGSNEAQARKHILHMTADIPNVVFVDGDCFEHQIHLAVLGGLILTDEALKRHGRLFKYYASIAIFSACVRELANNVFLTWTNLFGPADALKFAKTLVPKSSSGRWGCVDSIEKRILAPPFGCWVSVLNRVLLKKLNPTADELKCFEGLLPNDLLTLFARQSQKPEKPKQKAKPRARKAAVDSSTVKGGAGTGAEKVDVLAIEQLAEYTARIGKWRRHLLLTVNDPLFSRVVSIIHCTRAPLMHTSHFLKKDEGRTLYHLVCHKCESIGKEFDDLFCFLSRTRQECYVYYVYLHYSHLS